MDYPQNVDWEIAFQGELIAIEKNTKKWYERAVRPPGVRLILKNTQWNYLLTKEFRHEQWGFDYRLPGWKVVDSLAAYLEIRYESKKLESAVYEAAKIEAKEEAWIEEIQDLEILSLSRDGASVEWDLYYLTGTATVFGEQDLWWDELIDGIHVWFYSKEKVLEMIRNWDMKEERSIAVLVKHLS